jgi:predicted GNAT superfamily acetyltransferase
MRSMTKPPPEKNHQTILSPETLGFQPLAPGKNGPEVSAWIQELGGRSVTFRLLRTLAELAVTEDLQRDVFGLTDYDLLAAGELIVVHETGGEVIGAFIEEDGVEQAVGCLFGWGGYVDGRPRIVSDFMAVRKWARSGGIGAAMKRLQAAIAIARGFEEIIWTVDPLRSANARLNFGKLRAYTNRYIENLYGTGYGEAIYGGLPSDRIQVTWPIASPAVQQHLLRSDSPPPDIDLAAINQFDAERPDVDRATIMIPTDIDQIVQSDPATALEWRLRLRRDLQTAFGAGLAITDFAPNVDREHGLSAYIVERH